MAEHHPRPTLAVALALALVLPLSSGSPARPPSALPSGAPAAQAGPVDASDDAGAALPAEPPLDTEAARSDAQAILSGDDYQAPAQRDRTLMDRIRDWISDRLPHPSVGDRAGDGFDWFSLLVVAALLIVSVGGAIHLLARTRRSHRTDEDDEVDAEVELTPLRSGAEWEQEARRATDAGEHDLAVRAWFRAAVVGLADRDLVLDTPGRTVAEILDDLTDRRPALVDLLAPLAHLFEDVWFGTRPSVAADSTRARELHASLMTAARRRQTVSPAVEEPTATGGAP